MRKKITLFLLDKKAFPQFRHWALLILRIVAGYFLFMNHGFDKISAGPEKWMKLGALGLGGLGISFGHLFFGFMAAFSEGVCTVFVAFGFLIRFASFLLIMTMGVAGIFHLGRGESPESAFLYLVIYLALFLAGSGAYSIDRFLWNSRK
jgi:putative oxidoreductase